MDTLNLSLGFFFLILGITLVILVIYLRRKNRLSFSMNIDEESSPGSLPLTSRWYSLLAKTGIMKKTVMRNTETRMEALNARQEHLAKKLADLTKETALFVDESNAWFRNNGNHFQLR